MQKLNLLTQCLNRAKRWRCPVHWQPDDWREELLAVAWAALWEGVSNGIKSDAELRRFIMASLMRRYRDEWNYGVRWTIPPLPDDWDGEEQEAWSMEQGDMATDQDDDEEEANWLGMVVRQALARLTDDERYLIERRFWDGATEKELAREFGISQPAIHKRFKQIFERLRTMLE